MTVPVKKRALVSDNARMPVAQLISSSAKSEKFDADDVKPSHVTSSGTCDDVTADCEDTQAEGNDSAVNRDHALPPDDDTDMPAVNRFGPSLKTYADKSARSKPLEVVSAVAKLAQAEGSQLLKQPQPQPSAAVAAPAEEPRLFEDLDEAEPSSVLPTEPPLAAVDDVTSHGSKRRARSFARFTTRPRT